MTDTPIPISETAVPPPEDGSDSSSSRDLVLKVLGTIGTGIGVLGFVIFFGGAIIWVRADTAELPATEAVAAIPRNVLVTTGATFLFPAFLVAAGVVAIVFLIGLVFDWRKQGSLKPIREQAKSFTREAAQLGRAAAAAQQAWKAADAMLTSRKDDLDEARKRNAPGAEIAELEAAVQGHRVETDRLQAAAEGATSAASSAKANADDLTEESEVELKHSTRQWWLELGVAFVALLVLVPWQNGAIFHVQSGLELAVLILAAASGTALALLVYRSTEKFVWFGVVAVIAVGVYLAAATYLSTHRNAKMQPIAALRSGHPPVVGAFVAETSEDLYVGTFREDEAPPRLIVIPRSQVTEIAIGPLLDQDAAHKRAITMALDECEEEIEEPKTESEPAQVKAACTLSQVAKLNSSTDQAR